MPDSEIESVCKELGDISNSIVVHTAGTSTIDVLKSLKCSGRGVFYPLQTFSRGREIDISIVPFLVEGESNSTENILFSLAESISDRVFRLRSDDRENDSPGCGLCLELRKSFTSRG